MKKGSPPFLWVLFEFLRRRYPVPPFHLLQVTEKNIVKEKNWDRFLCRAVLVLILRSPSHHSSSFLTWLPSSLVLSLLTSSLLLLWFHGKVSTCSWQVKGMWKTLLSLRLFYIFFFSYFLYQFRTLYSFICFWFRQNFISITSSKVKWFCIHFRICDGISVSWFLWMKMTPLWLFQWDLEFYSRLPVDCYCTSDDYTSTGSISWI